jgi:hypothetical protein
MNGADSLEFLVSDQNDIFTTQSNVLFAGEHDLSDI